jgi:hypothetical protein
MQRKHEVTEDIVDLMEESKTEILNSTLLEYDPRIRKVYYKRIQIRIPSARSASNATAALREFTKKPIPH